MKKLQVKKSDVNSYCVDATLEIGESTDEDMMYSIEVH
jgi:hypothetical protein